MNTHEALELAVASLTSDLEGEVTVDRILRPHRIRVAKNIGAIVAGAALAAISIYLSED